MDEIDLRMGAYELALIELAGQNDRAHVVAAIDAVRDGLAVAADADERTIRRQAIGLLEDGLHRFDPPPAGFYIRPA